MSATTAAASPSGLTARLRVGLLGHRDLDAYDGAALRATATRILERLSSAIRAPELLRTLPHWVQLADAPLRLVSNLAQGSDSLLVEAGQRSAASVAHLALLPCSPEKYAEHIRRDGPAASADARADMFERLLKSSESAIELDGDLSTSDGASAAFDAAARLLLDQSDLLIAIWDGQAASGPGGTGATCAEAATHAVPVVRIDPTRPQEIQLVELDQAGHVAFRTIAVDELDEIVNRLVSPPIEPTHVDSHHVGTTAGHLADELGGDRGGRLASLERLLLDAPLIRLWRTFRNRLAPIGPLPAGVETRLDDVTEQARRPARDAYELVDGLATRYASVYRGSFLLNYMLGALAVLLALASFLAAKDAKFWLYLAEFLTILLILVVHWRGTSRQVKSRAIDYRILAELLRHLYHMTPLGLSPSYPRPHISKLTEDYRGYWMSWAAATVERSLAIPDAVMDTVRVERCVQSVTETWIGGEQAYHAHNAERMGKLEHRLHGLAALFFWVTLVACALHLVPYAAKAVVHEGAVYDAASWFKTALGDVLTAIAAGAPALAAMAHGIATQAEFGRLARRSESVAVALDPAVLAFGLQPFATTPWQAARDETLLASQRLLEEASDWRFLYKAHTIPKP